MLDSAAYLSLSHPAARLLIEIARQYHSDDNGRMVITAKHLEPRGWRSPDVINRAKRELLDRGLIYQTVQGMRPHKASWYACTWWALDKLDGYDEGAMAGFERSAYARWKPPKNEVLNTLRVVGGPINATSRVVGDDVATTSAVA
ncbi:hypothetical protein WL21_11725 [Burkholderia ubonensis]|nr:hypothetical protein WJ81_25835 [Burkholderia ubonensis]KVZ69485.1 hypothetical protein WL21_11725 [Burkholderia ubonensis]KVZ71318.1 hypothetical protein WL20_29525 [Burkholderia ubonensis]